MEINRLSRETNAYVLDGVITVIDVENWKGYADTSYTAKVQARYTDLIVFNKWEVAGERRMDECLDRLGDMEGVETAWVRSERGRVGIEVVFGVDGALARSLSDEKVEGHEREHGNGHVHGHSHQSEVEVLSITLTSPIPKSTLDTTKLTTLLKTAPKDEIYRIKALLSLSCPLAPSEPSPSSEAELENDRGRYILNWAFGRWTCTKMDTQGEEHESSSGDENVLMMTIILARGESKKWKKKLEAGGLVELEGEERGKLRVEKIA